MFEGGRDPLAWALLLAFAGWLSPLRISAQELEPRAYSPNPVGVSFVGVAFGRSEGEVVFDPSVPIEDVKADLASAALAYGRTFELWDRVASLALALPYVTGDVSGSVMEESREVHRSGIADARVRLAVNLIGTPALTPAEFARREPRTTLGASLVIVAPNGQYDAARLVNIGSNRWAFKPELGLSYPVGHWFLEAAAGVWLFDDNDDFMGSRRSQDPMTSLQAHVSYTLRRGLWIAADATHYAGGRTHTDGVASASRQSATRVGVTFSVPFASRHSLKFAWSDGTSVRVGGDFSTLALAWQYVWF